MKSVTATEAQESLDRLLEEVAETGLPVRITSRKASAMLVSEEEWRALEETLLLMSIPGMAKSIRDGMKAPIEECVENCGTNLIGSLAEKIRVKGDLESTGVAWDLPRPRGPKPTDSAHTSHDSTPSRAMRSPPPS